MASRGLLGTFWVWGGPKRGGRADFPDAPLGKGPRAPAFVPPIHTTREPKTSVPAWGPADEKVACKVWLATEGQAEVRGSGGYSLGA